MPSICHCSGRNRMRPSGKNTSRPGSWCGLPMILRGPCDIRASHGAELGGFGWCCCKHATAHCGVRACWVSSRTGAQLCTGIPGVGLGRFQPPCPDTQHKTPALTIETEFGLLITQKLSSHASPPTMPIVFMRLHSTAHHLHNA